MAIGFGIIGCGMISDFHARALAEVRGAKLVACYSRSLESAKKLAEKYPGCKPYASLQEMLADPDLNAVTIATPSGAHLDPALAAAKAGKHLLIEKPLEITLKRCDKIISACEKSNVKLGVIFPSRFHEASQKMKQAIEAKRFGRLTLGDAYVKWFRTQEYYDSGAWRGTWKLDGGGALMNQAIHTVDLLTWLMGPVAEISAQTATLAHARIEVEDVATASLRFENGALGTIVASTAAYPGYLKRIEISGSEGTAILEEEEIKVWDFAKTRKSDVAVLEKLQNKTKTGGGASDPSAIGHHGHANQIRDFVAAIKKDKPPAIDGLEGRRSVEIILAIYKSAASGKSVTLPLKSDPVRKIRAT